MSKFEVNTGSPPPRRRYRISFRARPLELAPDGPWNFGNMEIISRNPEDAKEFARQIGDDGTVEYQILECEDITEGS
jgi:hypothetical protein